MNGDNQTCKFCRSHSENPVLGELIAWQDLHAHINCLYTASGLVQKADPESLSEKKKKQLIAGFDPNEVRAELKRGQRLRCRHCGINGACVGCSDKRCRATFHLNCLFDAKGFALFTGSFLAYCVHHRPYQDLKSRLLEYDEPPDCCICLFSIIDEKDAAELEKIPEDSPPSHQNSLVFHSPSTNSSRRSSLVASPPIGAGKSVTIVDGQVPLTPAFKGRPPNNSKRISMWELNASLCLDDIAPLVRPPPVWQRRLFHGVVTPATSNKNSSVLMATPASTSKVRGGASSVGLPFYTSWSHGVLHGQCCRPAWMHRVCIAGYARSAGLHHVKCPLCFNRDGFIKTLYDFGIWIPDRDASWELEPGAFAYSEDPSHEITNGEDNEVEENENLSHSLSVSYFRAADTSELPIPVTTINLETEAEVESITISPSITPLKELSLDAVSAPRRSIRQRRPSVRAALQMNETEEVDNEILLATTPAFQHRLSAVTEMSPDIENQPPKPLTIDKALKFSPPTTILKRRRTRRPTVNVIRKGRMVGIPHQRTVSMIPQRQRNNTILRQTSIASFLKPPLMISIDCEKESDTEANSDNIEATNELFRSFLANRQQPNIRQRPPPGRYSLRSSVSSLINSPPKNTSSPPT